MRVNVLSQLLQRQRSFRPVPVRSIECFTKRGGTGLDVEGQEGCGQRVVSSRIGIGREGYARA